jgi:hypothetical protein
MHRVEVAEVVLSFANTELEGLYTEAHLKARQDCYKQSKQAEIENTTPAPRTQPGCPVHCLASNLQGFLALSLCPHLLPQTSCTLFMTRAAPSLWGAHVLKNTFIQQIPARPQQAMI